MLVNLARRGFYGDGYDFSPEARTAAEKHLRENHVSTIRLLNGLDESEAYEYIFLFEVIGYFPDIDAELVRLRRMLRDRGKLVLSFVGSGASYSAKALGNQRFFSRAEMTEVLLRSGFRVTAMWNFGYPLANLLAQFLNLSLLIKLALRRDRSRETWDVRQTGLFHETAFMKLLGCFINDRTICPFARLQMLFRKGDRGNGYIVMAEKT
jgi:hypothetical protein